MPDRILTTKEIEILLETLNEDYKVSDIRLREGEYQYELAKGVASFQKDLRFPNVKDLIDRLYGTEKTNNIQFIRKIQTILKKMEKRDLVKILPKKKPWELQRYALSSFKVQDADNNRIALVTEQQIEKSKSQLQLLLDGQGRPSGGFNSNAAKIIFLLFAMAASYGVAAWTFTQSIINPIVFLLPFSVAVVCSLMLGRMFSQGTRT
ncbi:MAG: hypothetical protein JSV05_06505 [Candidatus Bathyarchaeota archaeon]|nr:MAG: hypothetical protein JSV05_06505 [Candidatus Bathyarchaeota archaeon]